MLPVTITREHHMARLNRMVQMALKSGLWLSMAQMMIGTVLYFFHRPEGTGSVSLSTALPELAHGNPLAFMVLGIIVLMITPAIRVGVAAVGYLLEGDRTFALISLGVVAVLVASVMIGAA